MAQDSFQPAHTAPRRIVVKLGTNVIMRADGRVALGLLCGLVESIAALRERGHEVLVVSSGSIGLGMERLGLTTRPTDLARIQACAATGQSRLMSIYEDAFDRLGCRTAQVLLTEDDFRSSIRHANLARTLEALLALGVIPVINENDTVSVAELDAEPFQDSLLSTVAPRSGVTSLPIGSASPAREKLFGDNDKLSALVATHIAADLLVLLSDVDGLYDQSPANPAARLIPLVPIIDDHILSHAQGSSGRGRGGMLSKLEAARIAQRAGLTVVIANGRTPRILERIIFESQPYEPQPDKTPESKPMLPQTNAVTSIAPLGTRFPGLFASTFPGAPSPSGPEPGLPAPGIPEPGIPAPGLPPIPEPPAPDTPSPGIPEPAFQAHAEKSEMRRDQQELPA